MNESNTEQKSTNLNKSFHDKGYALIPNFMSDEEVLSLRNTMGTLIENFKTNQIYNVFDAKTRPHDSDKYFLDSADKIHYFYEKDAFNNNGKLIKSCAESINKVGHGLHLKDKIFKKFSTGPKVIQVLASIGILSPVFLQSMYIFKQPGIGAQVPWHQDATFLYSQPNTTVGLWFALEDATVDNGCLWIMKNGHNIPLKDRYIRHDDDSLELKTIDSSSWPEHESIPLEVKKGSLIILHGLMPHMSKHNYSSKSRHAYTLHVMDHSSHYSIKNWLRLPA